MNTGQLTRPFRALGLMHTLDRLKFLFQRWKNKAENARFRSEHPLVALPPDYMLFEAFQLNYRKYMEGGRRSAEWLLGHLGKHRPLEGITILDWGCGPARMVRHLPELLGPDCRIHGTDYNAATIAWCRQHISGVEFAENQLDPPTGYPAGMFDAIYGISIFTHLSEPKHREWFAELMRISKPGAVLLLTTHGAAFRAKLTEAERRDFDAGQLVVRGKAVEGHRVYTAFQPPAYMHNLFAAQAEVLEHLPGQPQSWGIEQDIWVISTR